MAQNISSFERVLRVILGIYAMLLGFLFIQGVVGIIVGILGIVSFLTGATGFCGLYALLGKEAPEPAVDEEGR
ncbi:MAG: DUF2892 domain-containing protein [Anaerolineales bacterium]